MIGWPSGEKFNDTTSKACWETKVFNLTKGCQESSTESEHEHVRKTEANQISNKYGGSLDSPCPPSLGIEPNTSCRINGACNASMPNFAKSHCALRRVGQRQWAALHFSLVCHCFCETEVPLTIQLQAWGSVCKETENCDVNHWTNVMNRIMLHTHQLIRVFELGSQWTRWSAIGFLAMCLGMLVPLWKHSTSPW